APSPAGRVVEAAFAAAPPPPHDDPARPPAGDGDAVVASPQVDADLVRLRGVEAATEEGLAPALRGREHDLHVAAFEPADLRGLGLVGALHVRLAGHVAVEAGRFRGEGVAAGLQRLAQAGAVVPVVPL